VLVIFPFEAELYERAGVPVEFVGHPLVDLGSGGQPRSAFLRDRGLIPDAPTIALLPGSRPNELQRIVPGMVAAMPLIRAKVPDVQYLVACAPICPTCSSRHFLQGCRRAAGAIATRQCSRTIAPTTCWRRAM
jgi:lipid-A-disaccharide synthase